MKPEELINVTLGNGWRLTNVRQSAARVSGGCHSWCYYAEGIDEKRAFVKILDPNLNSEHDDPLANSRGRIQGVRVLEYYGTTTLGMCSIVQLHFRNDEIRLMGGVQVL